MAKVLLADESITIQKVVNLVLSEEGHEIKTATSGSDVIESLSSFAPDIILMDIKLPGEDGFAVTKKVKGNPQTAHIPVLLLSGAFDAVDESSLAGSGAEGSITKPFEAKDLLEMVGALLAGKGAAAEAVAEAEPVAEAVEEAVETAEPVAEAEPLVEAVEEAAEEEAVEVVAADEEEDLWDLGEAEGAAEPAAVEIAEAVATEPEPEPVQAAPVSSQASPAPAEVGDAVTAAITGQIEALVGSVDLKGILLEALGPGIKDTVEKILWEVTPELTERLIREAVTESMGSLNKELENIIWETVPELAESIIRKEIDKIRAES
jgi:CheY-like chemotaxis protein